MSSAEESVLVQTSAQETKKLAICIPTYKRSHLLRLLVEDLTKQTVQPDTLIVVDGDPDSGEVRKMLEEVQVPEDWQIRYVPSNHGNLSYQRYLGWRAAEGLKADILVYFDDDERLFGKSVLNHLITLLQWDGVVGVGCHIRFGATLAGSDTVHLWSKRRRSALAKLFGSGKKIRPGGLTPSGHRKRPSASKQGDCTQVEWLNGGVMAYRMSAISRETFSEDLFALYEHRIGRAEDTFLSRRVGARGKLLYTFRAVVDHPNADTPKAYAHEAYRFAYAATYSRRFLNDYYRVYEPPTASDRWALVKSYVGNVLLAWMRALTKPSKTHFALARGTTLGAIHGLTRPPTAKRLTPEIDWWVDAEEALKNTVDLNTHTGQT